MITSPTIWGMLKDLASNDIFQITGSGAPTDGTAGTGVGIAGPGSTYIDIANGVPYANIGTKASPVWTTYGVFVARATYDFAVDGGAVGLITFAKNCIIPANAIILGGVIDVITPGTTSASGTMSLGTSAGSSAASLKAALAAASYTGLVAVIPVFTAATMVKLTAAGQITGTIATGALTAGKWNILLAYVIGPS